MQVGQLVVETARALGLPAPASPTDFADARVTEVAQALARLADGTPAPEAFPDGVDTWLREFRIDWHPATLDPRRNVQRAGTWRIVGATAHPLAEPLREALDAAGAGAGIALVIADDEPPYAALLEAARLALADRSLALLIVHEGAACAGFARALHLERCLLYTSPSPRDLSTSRMPSSA